MISYCVFNVGERRVGIPLAQVREIVEPTHIVPTPIPLTPPFVHGLFNLRGQVLPLLDLAPFVGAQEKTSVPGGQERAVIVERGHLRFATPGRRIDTIEADPEQFTPLAGAALYPALEAEANTEYGRFQVIQLDRLEACLAQSLKQSGGGATVTAPKVVRTKDETAASAPPPAGDPKSDPKSEKRNRKA